MLKDIFLLVAVLGSIIGVIGGAVAVVDETTIEPIGGQCFVLTENNNHLLGKNVSTITILCPVGVTP